MATEKANKIFDAFQRYARNGDRLLIRGFRRKDVEESIDQFNLDNNRQLRFYKAMVRRVEELKEEEKKREKWVERLIVFILGIALTLITQWLSGVLKLTP